MATEPSQVPHVIVGYEYSARFGGDCIELTYHGEGNEGTKFLIPLDQVESVAEAMTKVVEDVRDDT